MTFELHPDKEHNYSRSLRAMAMSKVLQSLLSIDQQDSMLSSTTAADRDSCGQRQSRVSQVFSPRSRGESCDQSSWRSHSTGSVNKIPCILRASDIESKTQ